MRETIEYFQSLTRNYDNSAIRISLYITNIESFIIYKNSLMRLKIIQ